MIKAGAEATGTTSGIMKAEDPEAMMEEMIRAVRMAWDEVHGK
jgi:triosephosphate isomerase